MKLFATKIKGQSIRSSDIDTVKNVKKQIIAITPVERYTHSFNNDLSEGLIKC